MSISSDQGDAAAASNKPSTKTTKEAPSVEKKLTTLLLEAEDLLTKLKGRNVTYPSLLYTPGQLAAMSEQEVQQCQHGWIKPTSGGLYEGDAVGKAYLANAGLDISKVEQQFKQYALYEFKPLPQDRQHTVESNQDGISTRANNFQATDEFFEKKWQDSIAKCLDKLKFEEEKSLEKDIELQFIDDWKSLKKGLGKLLTAPSPSKKTARLDTERSLFSETPLADRTLVSNGMTEDKIREKEKAFGDVVRGLVEGHVAADETYYPITGQLLKAVSPLKSMQDAMSRSYLDIVKYVGVLTQEDRQVTRRMMRSKEFPEKGIAKEMHLKGTLQYLEKVYLTFIDKTLMQYPKEAMLGGRPTLNDKVRAFLHLRLSHGHMKGLVLDCVQGIPVWAQLFYLIRCGDVESAVSFVKMNANVFYRLDGNMMLYLEAYYEDKLEGDLKKKVVARYHELQQANPQTQDPYKIILYELLAAVPLASLSATTSSRSNLINANNNINQEPSVSGHHPSVLTTIEDWLWYHLMHCDATSSRLETFQGTILSLGTDYFLPEDATTETSDPLLYVKVLLWCGRYSEAIQTLSDMNFSLEAVHLTLLLAYAHLLPMEEESPAFTSYKQYLDDLTNLHPQLAFYYIMALALFHPPRTLQDVALNLLKSWTLKTDDIAFAYGTMDTYGHYHGGELIKYQHLFIERGDTLRTYMASLIGRALEEAGKPLESLTFYHMAGDAPHVLFILANLLSDTLPDLYYTSTPSLFSTVEHAKTILTFYNISIMDTSTTTGFTSPTSGSSSSMRHESLVVLLVHFYDALLSFHQKQYEQVISHLAPLWPSPQTLPNALSATKSLQLQLCQFWTEAPVLLKRHFGRLMDIYMNSLFTLFQHTLHHPKSTLYLNPTHREQKMEQLKIASRFSLLVVAQLQDMVPQQLCAKLTALDAQLETSY